MASIGRAFHLISAAPSPARPGPLARRRLRLPLTTSERGWRRSWEVSPLSLLLGDQLWRNLSKKLLGHFED